MNDRFLTPEELAACLRLRPSTVKSWAREGRIPCIRPSQRVVRFDLAAVGAALAARTWDDRLEPAKGGRHATP